MGKIDLHIFTDLESFDTTDVKGPTDFDCIEKYYFRPSK